MDVIPALLSDEEERKNIERCTNLLAKTSGRPVHVRFTITSIRDHGGPSPAAVIVMDPLAHEAD